MAPKLILTGFMATGKTTVGRELAKRLGWRLIDCDAEIVARAGKPIHQIFRDSGEIYFRSLERSLIAELASDPKRCARCGKPSPAVIATGGGAIVDPQNYSALRRAGVIICLSARPDVIERRISNVTQRPMLIYGGTPVQQRIAELMESRGEAYGRAMITIDTSERDIHQVVDAILEAIATHFPDKWTASP